MLWFAMNNVKEIKEVNLDKILLSFCTTNSPEAVLLYEKISVNDWIGDYLIYIEIKINVEHPLILFAEKLF